MHTIKNIIVNVIKDPSNLPPCVSLIIVVSAITNLEYPFTIPQIFILGFFTTILISGLYDTLFSKAQTYKDVKNIIRDWWK